MGYVWWKEHKCIQTHVGNKITTLSYLNLTKFQNLIRTFNAATSLISSFTTKPKSKA